MDVGPLVVLGLMWVVLSALRKGGGKPADRSRTPPARPSAPHPPGAPRPRSGPSAGTPTGVTPQDPTQREGSQLERLLRELGRSLDQAQEAGSQPQVRRLPPAPQAEPQAQSLETDPARGQRAVVNQDDEAERLEEQRLAAAEANSRPLTDADHEAFEQRIRQEPADKTASRGYTTKQLRQAVVWREILGPPVSLRGDGSTEG